MKKVKIIVLILITLLLIIFPLKVNAIIFQPQLDAKDFLEPSQPSLNVLDEPTYPDYYGEEKKEPEPPKDKGNVQVDPTQYESKGPSTTAVEDMYKYGGKIAGTIQIVGVVVSAGALIIIGIKFIFASAEEKAEYKQKILPYVIGAVLLFGATNIVRVLNKAITNKDATSKTDSEIRALYKERAIATYLMDHNNSFKIDRETNTMIPYTIEEYIEATLDEYSKEIYYEAKKRGLLSEGGIYLKP